MLWRSVWLLASPVAGRTRVLRPRGFGLGHAHLAVILVLLVVVLILVVLARNNRR